MIDYTFSLVEFEYFLLILVRIATFVFVAPFFNLTTTPTQTKIGFSAILAIVVANVISPVEGVVYESAFGYAIVVLKEASTGLLIGFAANVVTHIINFAGFVIDMDIGISMAQEFNPILNTQATITGQIYYYCIMMILLITGLYQYLIRVIVQTFELIPLGGIVFKADEMLQAFVSYMANYFIIAFQIMLPIFAAIMILNCVLGIMAKVAPQMNMFSVGIQFKVFTGLAVLFLTVSLIPHITEILMTEMRRIVVQFVQSMY